MEKSRGTTSEDISELGIIEHSLVIDFLGRLRGLPPDLRIEIAQNAKQSLEEVIVEAQEGSDSYPRSFEPAIKRTHGLHLE